MVNDWTKNWFLPLYDRSPFFGSMLGLACIIFAFAVIGSFTAAMKELAGFPTLVVIFALTPFFVMLLKPLTMVIFLANESLWKSLGIYNLLGIEGRPIRSRKKVGD